MEDTVFGARPKLVRTPIISVSNPLYNVVEVDIHAPPVSPIPLNSVVSDCQESFENIVDTGSAKLIQEPVRKIQGSTDKELRTKISSGTNRNSDSKNSRRSNTRAECSLSESSSSTSIFNPSFEELRGKKDRLSRKQSSSLDVITSVIPEYSLVGHGVGADRSINSDEVSRDNNRIIEIPTRANPARAEGSKRTSPGDQAADGNILKWWEKNIDIPSGGISVSSRTSPVCTKKKRIFPKLFSKPGNTKDRRGRRLSHGIGNTQAGDDQSIEQIKSASPSQEVLTQNIYPGVRIIDQENEEEFEEINFISSFSFRGTSPESEQAEPSGQSKTIRESVSPEPEKTIAREQNSSLRRTSPGGQTEPSEQSQRFGVFHSIQSEKTFTKEQALDGIFAGFGESRNSTTTNKGTEPMESIHYRNQKQHRKIPSTPQTSPKRSAGIEDLCLLSNTNLITKMNTDTTPKFAAASDLSAFKKVNMKYSVRMEAIESNKERHEFVNAINQTSHSNNSDIQEIKQIVREQHETVNAIASALKQGNKKAEETATDQSKIANCIQEVSKSVSFLLTKDGKQQHVQKQVTFQNQIPNFQPAYPNNGNGLRLPYKPFISNNTQPNQPFYNRPSWQPRPARSQQWQPNQNAFQQPGFRPNFSTPFQTPHQPSTPTQQFTRFPLICFSCGVEGHVKNNCPVPRQQNFQPNFPSNFQSNYQPNFHPLQRNRETNKYQLWLRALFDTGAARSVMHYNLFQSLPQRSRGTCSKLDFDLYDVHDKKLNTFGQVILPLYYGDVRFFQNFVISYGISEDCILGWDAIRKHGFTINGENQSIYLAREEPDQQKGTSGLAPEMTIAASQRVKIPQQSVMVIEAKMKRSFPYVSPKATVVFTSNKTLPGGIVIRDFVSTVSNDGKYSLLVENHSRHSVCLPRSSQLGTIEIASSMIGKVKIDDDSSLGDKTQVWLNCEDPEKGNMDNDNKLMDKTQVWLNFEDPDKV
ncbi:hypothetical protein DAPPUDRAFT_104884 [Daphnia pulex]|uniref:CCHC-type domain-containing protein n=1 Tax=Daphnia pulex TaxID=6669 RepID=E9GNM7_DAPPU|nr:hypothetical protein DAPPUDRAFT_104884 [Daphnia pulex]|eukprot:EFX78936.1 hypothetical protein DAPPUDRAFT_104884 [Daphnia pulex]